MSILPFSKALLYLAVVRCRIDFEQPSLIEFMSLLNEYFSFISIDSPFACVQDQINKLNNLPASVPKGNYTKNALNKFLKESNLQELHDFFEKSEFLDLLYDVDLRKKIDGMAISGFRPLEIEQEIKQCIENIDIVMVRVYIDCFANFYKMDINHKRNYVVQSLEDPSEQKILLRCLETKSKDTIRLLLGVSSRNCNPIDLVNRIAQITVHKTQEGLLEQDDLKLQRFMSLGIKVADTLHKLGVGNQDAAKQLLEVLSKKPEEVGVSTRHYTVDELEKQFLSNQTKKEDIP